MAFLRKGFPSRATSGSLYGNSVCRMSRQKIVNGLSVPGFCQPVFVQEN